MDKKRKGTKKDALTPEEILARGRRARLRFRAAVRFAIQNLYWLGEGIDQKLGEDIQKNIMLITRKKGKKGLLSLEDKTILNQPAESRTEDEKVYLSRIIGGLKCFRRYPSDVKSQLAAVTYYYYYRPGRTIVRQGHESHSLYFIVTGEVAVSQEAFDPILGEWVRQDLGQMGPGDMFGEVSLLHNIPRTGTVESATHVELLCLKKRDFEIILKDTVKQQWDTIRASMRLFSYFNDWDEIAIRECCILSKLKTYEVDQTILGDGIGLRDYAYFVLKGQCSVIHHLTVKKVQTRERTTFKLYTPPQYQDSFETKMGLRQGSKEPSKVNVQIEQVREVKSAHSKKTLGEQEEEEEEQAKEEDEQAEEERLKALRPSPSGIMPLTSRKIPAHLSDCHLPLGIETYFIQVCLLNPTACFGLGENMVHRRVVAVLRTECFLVPRYWLMQKNKGNIWNRVIQFLDKHIPSTKGVFNEFVSHRRWLNHRKQLVEEILTRRKPSNNNTRANIPYSIRINEEIEF